MISEKNIHVSVAMAVYNGERYLAEQLQSLVDQTYRPIEIIITDDASEDNSVAIIKDFREKYPFIKLLLNDANQGVTETFENSIKNCKGDYIALSDQDDIWEPEKIESMIRYIGKEDAYYCNSILVDRNGVSLDKTFSSVMKMRSYYSGAPFLVANCVPGHNIIMRRLFAESILPIPKNIMFDRWISYCAAATNGIRYVDLPLVRYRQHDTNTIGIRKSRKGKRPSRTEKYNIKLAELKSMAKAPIKDEKTKLITAEMISLFKRKLSLKRSLFFFRNYEEILSIKNKSEFRKFLYCLKMFFKPNY